MTECTLDEMNILNSFILPFKKTFFSCGINDGGNCIESVYFNIIITNRYQMNLSPYQILNPFLIYSTSNWGIDSTFVYQANSHVNYYLNIYKSFCEMTETNCFFLEINNLSEMNNYAIIDLYARQTSGYIINAFYGELSNRFILKFLDSFNLNKLKLISIFPDALEYKQNYYNENQLENLKYQFFLAVGYPSMLKETNIKHVINSILASRFTSVSNSLFSMYDSFLAMITMFTIDPTSIGKSNHGMLSSVSLNSLPDKITFDSSNTIQKKLYLLQYSNDNKEFFKINIISECYPGNQGLSTFIFPPSDICEYIMDKNKKSYSLHSQYIGLMVSLSGEYKELNVGLIEIMQSFLLDLNQKHRIDDNPIVPIIMNDQSILDKTKANMLVLLREKNVKFIFGLVDYKQKLEVESLFKQYNAVLFYYGNVGFNECKKNIFFFNNMITSLYTLPSFIKDELLDHKIFILYQKQSTADMELSYFKEIFTRVNIEIVGVFIIENRLDSIAYIFNHMIKLLNLNGFIVTNIKGVSLIQLLTKAEEYRKSNKNNIRIISLFPDNKDFYTDPTLFLNDLFYMRKMDEQGKNFIFLKKLMMNFFPYSNTFSDTQLLLYESLLFFNAVISLNRDYSNDNFLELDSLEYDGISGKSLILPSHYLADSNSLFSVKVEDGLLIFQNTYHIRKENTMLYLSDIYGDDEVIICDWKVNKTDGKYELKTFKVGIIYDLTGSNSFHETQIFLSLLATIQHQNDNGGILTMFIKPVIRNSEGSSEVMIKKHILEFTRTKDLIAIFGCATTECRDVIRENIKNTNLRLFYTGDSVGEECINNVIQIGTVPNQLFGSIFALVVSNNIYPYVTVIYEDIPQLEYYLDWIHIEFEQVGGIENLIKIDKRTVQDPKIIETLIKVRQPGAIILLLHTMLLSHLMSTIIENNALFIMMNNYVLSPFIKAVDIRKMNPNFVQGLFVCETYFNEYKNEDTDIFNTIVAHYSGISYLSAESNNGYTAFNILLAAIAKSNSLKPEIFNENIIGLKVMSASGPVTVTASNLLTQYVFSGRFINGAIYIAFALLLEVQPEAFNSKMTAGKICSWNLSKENGIVEKDYTYVVMLISLIGTQSFIDSQLPYTLLQIISTINIEGKKE